MLDFQAARWLIGHEVPGQAGNDHPTSIPTGVFATSDGHINIAASGDDIYRRFCIAMEAPQLAADPDFATGAARSKNRHRLNEAIGGVTRARSSADWIERLNAAGVPCGPIYQMNEVFADPQVQHLGSPVACRIRCSVTLRWSGRRSNCPARHGPCAVPRLRPGSTPRRSCANSTTERRRSPRCEIERWCKSGSIYV